MNFASSPPSRVPKAAPIIPKICAPGAPLDGIAAIETFLARAIADDALHGGALARDKARRRHDWIRALDAVAERLTREGAP